MYRSASTLQFQIAARLIQDAGMGQSVGWIDFRRFAQVQEAQGKQPGMKVVKVHRWSEAIATEFHQGNARGIYTFRDLRDVYASYMQQRRLSFDELWQEGFVEECLTNYQRWTTLPQVLVSHYGQIMANLPLEVERIATHVGIPIPPAQSQTIAQDYTVDRQQQRIQQFRDQLLHMPRNPDDHRNLVDYHDEGSLLHINHLNSGKTGRWKDDLTREQVTRIEAAIVQWCEHHAYAPHLFLEHPLEHPLEHQLEHPLPSVASL